MAAEKRRIKNETEKQRWDRNFADLLQELRVAQTGVQILFAFLLTLPFSNGFPKTTAFQKDIYLVALISAAAATAMIIAPVAFHRALFRQGRKPELVRYAHRMATTGVGFLLIAMVSSVLLITDYLLSFWAAAVLTVVTGVFFLTFWAAIPVFRHNWIDQDLEEEDEESAEGVADPNSPDGVVTESGP
jgi:O-antigen/teichoic acid export membrane protein